MASSAASPLISRRPARRESPIAERMKEILVGQDEAIEKIVPFVELFQSGLTPGNRPAGVVMCSGPTGSGKSMTVAALAQILHSNDRSFMRIDCEEFQLDHEVGKLVGAPPGYLGHRETAPRLNQSKLNAVASDRCGLSLVLFDEVEKAAESLHRMLLGVFDHGRLTLGDNTPVDFSRTLIFMTSNVGQKDMLRELQNKGVGFPGNDNPVSDTRLDTITNSRLRRSFSAEFLNRIDAFVTYHPLTRENLSSIFDLEFDKLRVHILVKLDSTKTVSCTTAAKDEIVDIGLSPEFGAREIKRLLNKHLLQALAGEMTSGERRPKHVNLDFAAGQFFLSAV